MSISEPLAVTMMIGTFELLRSSRHTSMPETFGQHDVEQHEVGRDGVEQVERLGAVAGDLHPEPLPLAGRPSSASTKDSSSSTTSTVVDWPSLIRPPASCSARRRSGHRARTGRQPQRERRALALLRRRPGTSPPWLLATWRTMARPSPVPPVSRLRARSTR